MSSILASVVIPSYNCDPWLEQCVKSALALSDAGIEIIVVDDGSTDDTPRICDELTKRYSQVRVIRQKNAGLSAARNVGIEASRGGYILLLDADDELIPFDLPALLAGGHDIVRVGVEQVNMDGSLRHWKDYCDGVPGAQYLKTRLGTQRYYSTSWAYIFRRELLQDHAVKFEVGLLHEDVLFTIQSILKARSVSATETLVYRWKIRAGSITTSKGTEKVKARLASLDYIIDQLLEIARKNPGINLGAWIFELTEYYKGVIREVDGVASRTLCWRVFGMQLRAFMERRCWGNGNVRRSLIWNLGRTFKQAVLYRQEPQPSKKSIRRLASN